MLYDIYAKLFSRNFVVFVLILGLGEVELGGRSMVVFDGWLLVWKFIG